MFMLLKKYWAYKGAVVMKKAMEVLVQFKFVWGLFYAASIIIYTIVNSLLGKTSMDFLVVWQLLILTIIIVIFHYILFGEFILTKLKLKQKLIIHSLLCYTSILIFMVIFDWIEISSLSSVLLYTGAYLIFYLGILNSMHMYYKATGEELNSKLAIYKEKKNIN